MSDEATFAPSRPRRRAAISFALALGLAPALGCETTEVDDDGDSAADDDGDTGSASTPDDSADDDSATTPDDSADDDDGDDTDATPGTIGLCQDECDFQLEFECIDVDEHEACFTACSARSQAELDLFLACTDSAPLCSEDPGPRRECLANFLDIDTPGDTGTVETGSEGPNCVEACQNYLETPCDPPIEGVSSCDEFCGMLSEELQQVAAECLDNAVGCELPADCQLPGAD